MIDAAGQPEKTGCGKWPQSRVLHMFVCKVLFNVNDTRALIGLCLLRISHLGQIHNPANGQICTLAHIVIGLSLHIYSFLHLSIYSPDIR